jgi:hypothetical protein
MTNTKDSQERLLLGMQLRCASQRIFAENHQKRSAAPICRLLSLRFILLMILS